jgi:hypothetical protein
MQNFLAGRPSLNGESRTHVAVAPRVGFQPLLAGENPAGESIPARATASSPRAEVASPAEPQIEVVNHEGRIERIVVTCTCCQRIELRCEY